MSWVGSGLLTQGANPAKTTTAAGTASGEVKVNVGRPRLHIPSTYGAEVIAVLGVAILGMVAIVGSPC